METKGVRRNSPTGTNHQSFKKSHIEGEGVEVADLSSLDILAWKHHGGNGNAFVLVGSVCASRA